MYRLKACPKCKTGDMYLDGREDDRYADWVCICCGNRVPLIPLQPLKNTTVDGRAKSGGKRKSWLLD
jgi:hypothetical protein